MKKAILILTLLIGTTGMWAINEQQKKEMKNLLEKAGYASKFYEKDQSVNIMYDKVNYWFTVESMGNLVKVQMNRRGYSLKGEKKYFEKPAMQAANDVNQRYPLVKMYCTSDSSLKICEQFILAEIDDLKPEVVNNNIKVMHDAAETFQKAYDQYNAQYQKTLEEKKKKDIAKKDTVVIVPQGSDSKLSVIDVNVASFSSSDKQLTDFGKTLIKNEVKYIKPQLSVESSEAGKFNIKVRIINPSKKIMKRSADSQYAIESTIEIKKAGKQYICELGKFGSQTGEIWEKGTYTLEFWEGDNSIEKTTFRIE